MHLLQRFHRIRVQYHADHLHGAVLALPNELLLHVCSYLDRAADLQSVSLTCKTLNGIASQCLYREITTVEWQDERRWRSLLKTLRQSHISDIVTRLSIYLPPDKATGLSGSAALWAHWNDTHAERKKGIDEALKGLYNLEELTIVCRRYSEGPKKKPESLCHSYLTQLGARNLTALSLVCDKGDVGLLAARRVLRASCLQSLTSLHWDCAPVDQNGMDREAIISEAEDCFPILEHLKYTGDPNPFLERLFATHDVQSLTCYSWSQDLHKAAQSYPARRRLKVIGVAPTPYHQELTTSDLWRFLDLVSPSAEPYRNLVHIGIFCFGRLAASSILETMRRLTFLPNLQSIAAFNTQYRLGVTIDSWLRDPWNEGLLVSISTHLPGLRQILTKVPPDRRPGTSAILWTLVEGSWRSDELSLKESIAFVLDVSCKQLP